MSDETQDLDVDERHPIRFVVRLAFLVGLTYAAGRFLAKKKDEYAGLTESEARDKFVEKMSPRVGDETAAEIADQVIPKLKDRGLVKADPVEAAAEEIEEAAQDMERAADEAADKVSEAVDSVVKD